MDGSVRRSDGGGSASAGHRRSGRGGGRRRGGVRAVLVSLGLVAAVGVLDAAPASGALAANYSNPTTNDAALRFANPAVLKVTSGGTTTFYAYGNGDSFTSPTLSTTLPIRTSTDLAAWSAPSNGALSATWASSSSVTNFTSPSVAAYVSGGTTTYAVYFTGIKTSTTTKCIGVATSTSPTGPFVDSSATPLVCPGSGARDPSIVLGSGNPQLIFYGAGGSGGNGIYNQPLQASGLAVDSAYSPILLRAAADSAWYSAQLDRPAVIVSGGTAHLFTGGYTRAHADHGVSWSRCTSATPISGCRERTDAGPTITTTSAVSSPGGFQPFVDDAGKTWIAYDAYPGGTCAGSCPTSDPTKIRTLRIDKLCIDSIGPRTVAPSTGSQTTTRNASCVADGPAWASTFANGTLAVPDAGASIYDGGLDDDTLRQGVHTTISGTSVRVTLSNEGGDAPLVVADTWIAENTVASDDNLSTSATVKAHVTFGGQEQVTVPVGQRVTSDAVPLSVQANWDLAVTMYITDGPTVWTGTRFAGQSVWKATGDRANPSGGGGVFGSEDHGNYFVASVDVLNQGVEGTVAVIGDSKSDGGGFLTVTPNDEERYSDRLMRRVIAVPRTVAIPNVSSAGNNLQQTSSGDDDAGVARFGRDVLARPGIRTVIIALGTNDLYTAMVGSDIPTGDMAALQTALRNRLDDLIDDARADGLRVIGTTLPPLAGPVLGGGCTPDRGSAPPHQESVRVSLNAWISGHTGTGEFHDVVDFADIVDNPSNTTRVLCGYDILATSHLDIDGHREEGTAIPLTGLF
jgi:lysophospholipase L1-like esterase